MQGSIPANPALVGGGTLAAVADALFELEVLLAADVLLPCGAGAAARSHVGMTPGLHRKPKISLVASPRRTFSASRRRNCVAAT